MKANELRIGNLLYQEQTIDDWEVKSVLAGTIIQCEINPDGFEPIPLTEEWLLRFGFEFCDYEPSADDDDDFIFKEYRFNIKDKKVFYTICECPCNEWEFCVVFPWTEPGLLSSIKYVHQLQNLYFALTGQELELRSES